EGAHRPYREARWKTRPSLPVVRPCRAAFSGRQPRRRIVLCRSDGRTGAMFETYRMLGQEHEADLAREADRVRLADPFRQRRRRRRAVRAAVPVLAVAVAFVLIWLFAWGAKTAASSRTVSTIRSTSRSVVSQLTIAGRKATWSR